MSDISAYLQSLHKALAGSDPALIQDALSETEARFRLERERLAWSEPMLSGADAVQRVLAGLGAPQARAETYRQRDLVVAEALGSGLAGSGMAGSGMAGSGLPGSGLPGSGLPGSGLPGSGLAVPRGLAPASSAAPEEPARPWPGLFGVFLEPKAYTSVVYLLVSLATGIFYFTWAITGLALSMGFLVLIIGFPLLVLFLGSVRALGLGEGRLVEALLDVRMPRRPPLLPEGTRWMDRLKGLFVDSYTWKCLLYLVMHLPLGILSFVLALTGLALSLSLVASPILHWVFHLPLMEIDGAIYTPPAALLALFPLGGALGLAGTLHLALGLGRLHGSLARTLLVRAEPV